ncbi:alpha-2-macroglobulin family protein [Sinomicrobium sp. M5D2P17]
MGFKRLLLSATALLFLFACKDKDQKQEIQEQISNLYKYREYVSDVSQGIISAHSDVKVMLREPVSGWDADKELPDALINVSPKTKGKVVALNNQTIAFVPESPLKQDTEYEFTLRMEAIVSDIPEELRNFRFKVKTIKQQFNVTTERVQSYNRNWQYVEGTLRSSDQLSAETAGKLVQASQEGKNLSVKLYNTTETNTLFRFKIDSIQRMEEDSKVKLTWNGKTHDIDSEGEGEILIPGKNNFTVMEVNVAGTEKPYVEINFSDPLKKNQNFNGLVSIQDAGTLKFSVEGNILKVYPQNELKGVKSLEVFQGILNVDDYKLKQVFSEQIAFEQLKPEVRMLQNGSILPSSNNLKINFEAVNLNAVDVSVIKIFQNNILQFLQYQDLGGEGDLRTVARPIAKKTITLQGSLSAADGKWHAYALDLRELINPDPGAIYRVEFRYKPSYSTYKCDQTNFPEEDTDTEENYDEEEESSYWDNVEGYYYYEDYYYDYTYDWRERENPCHTSYYRDKKVAVNVLASDLGVTIKKGDNESYFVSVTDLVSAKPEGDTKVVFYNFQQQEVATVVTDKNGFAMYDATLPAYFAIAEKGKQKTYVKLSDGNVLSVSKFDVSGVKLQKGIKGYIYGERGVWRPGDTLFLSFILNDKSNKLPAGHPVKFELRDPYGKITRKEVRNSGTNNFYTFITPTDQNAPTGSWQAQVSVGGAVFSKSMRIETIKPNRLKIKADFADDILSGAKPVNGSLAVAWLHGAIARNLKADIQARFQPQNTSFKQFPGYTFNDPSRSFGSEEQTVFDGKLDAEGKASFSLKPQLEKQAPGMLQASFITKVYETGGDFSTDVFTKTYSPYSTYIGLNTPKGDKTRGMLLTDTRHRFEVVSVDEKGNPKAVKGLKVNIYKVSWRWWWDTSEDNLSSYNGSNQRENVFSQTLHTGADGKAAFEFELKYPEWGRYLVHIEDPEGGHATGKTVYIDWPGWAGKSMKNDPSSATMLVFSTDKENYKVGEKAVVTFPGSAGGRALVTVENGTEVLHSMWVEAQDGETRFELPIAALYTPNVYIHISLLQPHASTANDLPIRLYGVVPITVEDPETRLEPQVNMPDVLKPEETVTVKVREKEGKSMTYTIAVVDDGLLDLTRFKTPDAWESFFAREALGVKTWDIYDDVIGAFGGRIDQVFSIGGDEELAGAKNKKANRFKPMVVYLGPFTLDKGQTRSHEIHIPKYIGSVRTMIVGGAPDTGAYGSTEKTTPVRKPLMVLASLPRKITPGEKVTLPVTIFAMEDKVKNVTIQVKDNKAFRVVGGSSQTISFDRPDEKIAYFELEISDFEGIGKVEIAASGNGEKASYGVEIDVVNPNPVTTSVRDLVLEPGSSGEISLETFGVAGSNTASIEFSTLPPMNFNGRMQYLIRYPHGCVEQVTSAVFPQLFLSDIFDLTANKKQEVQKNAEQAIKRLGGYQLPNGGFAYWNGQNYANDWGSSYAGHFLLEAEKKGYVLPIGFKNSWINYQKQAAKQWRQSAQSSDLAQAYRLYTLALAENADVSSMNRLRETPNISNEAKHRLAAAYALIGQKNAAKDIFATANIDFKPVKYDYYTYGSTERNRALALETLILLDEKVQAQEMAGVIAKSLNTDRWMSTQSTAYSLLAMAKFAGYIGGKGIDVSYEINGKSTSLNTALTLAERNLGIKEGNNTVRLKNNKENTIFVRILNNGILPVGQELAEQQNLSAKVTYKGRDGKVLDVSNLPQGTNFIAEVSITNQKGENLKNIALSHIFPSGWEIVNTRFTDFGDAQGTANEATYTDLRDDRANFYFDLDAHKTKTFRVLVNASYLGRYYLPGIQCEAMYDNDYRVRTKGQWVEVGQ